MPELQVQWSVQRLTCGCGKESGSIKVNIEAQNQLEEPEPILGWYPRMVPQKGQVVPQILQQVIVYREIIGH